MAATDIPSAIDVSGQTARRLRYGQVRGLNTIDYVKMIHNEYAAADIPAAIDAAAWSQGVNIQGYDKIALFVVYDEGTGGTRILTINTQVSFMDDTGATYWYDRATNFDVRTGNSNAISKSSPTWNLGDGSFVIEIDCIGHFMRVQPTLNSTSTDSRVTIAVQRVMSGE